MLDRKATRCGRRWAATIRLQPMKSPIRISLFVIGGSCLAVLSAILPANAQVNVTQFHNHDSRDGLYVDSAFTPSAAANLVRDLNFDGTIVGNVYAQPLYIEDGPCGRAMIIAMTESNNVYALDAFDGSVIWERNVGDPVEASDLICTKFNLMGITGTPVVDLASRALFLDAMITPDGGETKKHLIFSLNLDTGDINPGWPVDVELTASYNGINFTAEVQQQRPALGIVANILYVGDGSMRDCPVWHGWLVGIPTDNPTRVTAWAAATAAGSYGGAIWGVGGVASDGMNPFVTTGNTSGTGGVWGGGEEVISFQPGPIFSGLPAHYWAPTNWSSLDQSDADLGASGPLLVDVTGAMPSHLIVAMGKDRKAYLVKSRQPWWCQPACSISSGCQQHYSPGSRHLADQTGYLCRVPRQQRRQHRPLRFPHYCGQSACYRHPWRFECEPAHWRLRLAFCHLY